MTSPILVTGGTGTLGTLVVKRLRAAGQPVRVLSRSARSDPDVVVGDLNSGHGVERAMSGVGTIVHCAGAAKGDDARARTLVHTANRAGVRHVVNLSVVGADRIPVKSAVDRAMFGYFANKRAAELVVANGDVPWTTLRATQFYDLILLVARQLAKMPVVPVPAGMGFQPIDTDEVAARVVELAVGPPAGLVPEIAGPRVSSTRELVTQYLDAIHRHKRFMSIPLPGGAAKAIRAGANTAPDHAVGHRTWEEFLADQSLVQ